MGCQGTKWRRNITEMFNRFSRAPERYRGQTDRQTDDSIAFTFAKIWGTSKPRHHTVKMCASAANRYDGDLCALT